MRRALAHGVRFVVFLLALFVAGPAVAGERISVFMVVDGDRALAENLVEVTIAELSGAGDWELIGMRELESPLSRLTLVKTEGLAACLAAPACLSEVGARAGTRRAVIGKVERAPTSFEVTLSLVDTETFSTERQSESAPARDVNELIAIVQRSAAKLFDHDASPPIDAAHIAAGAKAPGTGAATSATIGRSAADPRPSAAVAVADASPAEPDEKPPVSTYLGFGAAGLAVVAFSAAVIAGSVAKSPPSGETRKERQEDLERRNDYAVAANIAFAAGGVLSAVAVVAFVWE
jgi:hypothetical protein